MNSQDIIDRVSTGIEKAKIAVDQIEEITPETDTGEVQFAAANLAQALGFMESTIAALILACEQTGIVTGQE